MAVVGNSLGGRVALELAQARPELVRALVLVGTVLPGDGERSAALTAFDDAEHGALADGELERAVDLNVEMWLADGTAGAVREEVRRMQRRAFELQLLWGDELNDGDLVHDLPTRLAEVAVPTFVVVGDEDVEDLRRYAQRLVSSIAGAELAVVAGAAHVPSLERPEAFDAAVLPFLERVFA